MFHNSWFGRWHGSWLREARGRSVRRPRRGAVLFEALEGRAVPAVVGASTLQGLLSNLTTIVADPTSTSSPATTPDISTLVARAARSITPAGQVRSTAGSVPSLGTLLGRSKTPISTATTTTTPTTSPSTTIAQASRSLAAGLSTIRSSIPGINASLAELGSVAAALASAGVSYDPAQFQALATRLNAALADGTFDSDPTVAASIRAEFDALFEGSTVGSATIDRGFNAVVSLIRRFDAFESAVTQVDAARATILDALANSGGQGGRGRRAALRQLSASMSQLATSTASQTADTSAAAASTARDGATALSSALAAVDAAAAQVPSDLAALGSVSAQLSNARLRYSPSAFRAVASRLDAALADGTFDSDPTVAASIRGQFARLFARSGANSSTVDRAFDAVVALTRTFDAFDSAVASVNASRAAIGVSLTGGSL